MNSFDELGLSEASLDALRKKGFEEPTGIQAKIIPLVLQGDRDIIGQARTGTGKTAAFGLPLLEKLTPRGKSVQALILTPTRELAIQVAEELHSLRGSRPFSILPVYGGQVIGGQIRSLRDGVDIVVGTPGRVIDHIGRKTMDLSNVSFMILDEADEMLNMGFIEEVEEILKSVSSDRRTLLFSATMPPRIRKIAETYMKEYELIAVEAETEDIALTDQISFEVLERDKFEALCRIIDMEEDFFGLVFCRTKVMVDELSSRLGERGYSAEGLHGDISQAGREIILGKFRKKKINILVATDVAARGIDIQNLSHVINYSLPQEAESYIHRIGRTGRAGKEGTAVTFVTPAEYRKLLFLKRMTKSEIRKAKVPGVDEVIGAKRKRVLTVLKKRISEGENTDFLGMAEELLSEGNPADVLSAVLSHALRDKFDTSKYEKIRDLGDSSVDRTGKARLSIRMGRRDGATKRLIVDLIEKESGVPGNLVREVDVFDGNSFVSVPFHEAEKILKAFNKKERGNRPLVEIDKGRRPAARFDRPKFERPRYDKPHSEKPYYSKFTPDGSGDSKPKKHRKKPE